VNRSAMSRLSGAVVVAALVAGLAPIAGAALADGDYVIQLASVKSEERAHKAWAEMQAKHAQLLGDLQLMVQTAEIAGQGTFYRMQAGPFPNEATAEDMCLQLRAAKLDCLVRKR
jgi:cell division septation protein DedD